MPVYQLADMPYEEFLKWNAYFEKRPVDWRNDDRAYKLLAAQGVKEKPWLIFQSLDPIYNSKISNTDGAISMHSFKRSSLFDKLLSAKDGDKGIFDENNTK